jgi:iduronate 2-sulfatase
MLAGLCAATTFAKPNVLLICVDDLRAELNSFGADYIHSPKIDRLAAEGRAFHRHFVNAPSCGPSRFTLLTGRYGDAGNHGLSTLKRL